jgi:hypothetical protein
MEYLGDVALVRCSGWQRWKERLVGVRLRKEIWIKT